MLGSQSLSYAKWRCVRIPLRAYRRRCRVRDGCAVADSVSRFRKESDIWFRDDGLGVTIDEDLSHAAEESAKALSAEVVEANDLQNDAHLVCSVQAAVDGLREAQAINPDAYAWLVVPGLVSQPVLQSSEDDGFYFDHAPDGKTSALGSVYTEKPSALDFSDSMTLVYGHTYAYADVVFSALNQLHDRAVFDSTPRFYLVTDESILAYRLVSAYEYTDEYIPSMLRAMTLEGRQAYYDFICDETKDSETKYTRAGSRLDAEADKVVQLSTCTKPPKDGVRWLVAGALELEIQRVDATAGDN